MSERVHVLVKSLAQDMIYCVSRGRVKTAKHTQFGIFVKKKTRCKQVVEALSRLGHCISYYEINALETAYADSQVNHHYPGLTHQLECNRQLSLLLYLTIVTTTLKPSQESLYTALTANEEAESTATNEYCPLSA